MRQSLQITRAGGPEVFKLVEQESLPLPRNGVRVQVSASGVNFADVNMRLGLYPEAPKPPFVPGYEVAGVATEIGPDVVGIKAGDRVVAAVKFGGYTTEAVVPDYQVRKIPSRMSEVEAAVIPVNFMTAWMALEEMSRVRKGDRVLIQSAAGGVGVAATQIAAQAGAHVIGLVGSQGKMDAVKALGASEVWLNDRWENGDLSDIGGFDIILDPTGGKSLKRSLKCLNPSGRVVNFGVSSMISGERRSIRKILSIFVNTPLITPIGLMMGNKGIFGLNMLKLFDENATPEQVKSSLIGKSFDRVMERFEDGRFKVIVGKTFPLAEGGAAHRHLQGRSNIGKVVLTC